MEFVVNMLAMGAVTVEATQPTKAATSSISAPRARAHMYAMRHASDAPSPICRSQTTLCVTTM